MKFKIGDRVVLTSKKYHTVASIGDKGTVVSEYCRLGDDIEYAIQMDRHIPFCHTCHGLVPDGYGQFWWESCLKLVEEKPTREFKLIITSSGDVTSAKLIHGERTVVKEVTATRYSKDEYSEKAAVEAVVKKIFDKGKEKDDLFNGKAMATVYMDTPRLIRGYIYTFKDGIYTDDTGRKNSIPYTNREMENHIWFIPIAE